MSVPTGHNVILNNQKRESETGSEMLNIGHRIHICGGFLLVQMCDVCVKIPIGRNVVFDVPVHVTHDISKKSYSQYLSVSCVWLRVSVTTGHHVIGIFDIHVHVSKKSPFSVSFSILCVLAQSLVVETYLMLHTGNNIHIMSVSSEYWPRVSVSSLWLSRHT